MWVRIIANECHVAQVKVLFQFVGQQDVSAQVSVVVPGPPTTTNMLLSQVLEIFVQTWADAI
jgi:hypothetical protein